MSGIVKRKTIEDIYKIKLDLLYDLKELVKISNKIDETIQDIKGYAPFRIDFRYDSWDDNRETKYIDRTCWIYLVNLFELQKYMLCTEYKKMRDDIDKFNFPEFTIENANGYIQSLKHIIYDNVKTMMKTVYNKITEETYYTGAGYTNRKEKKRNNNGIDSMFILTTYDYSRIFRYSGTPTITDDLEKLCYILHGEKLPDNTLIQNMYSEKKYEMENKYFKIRCCKNGNTHFHINEETRNKLNLYGSDPTKIGENIKIKIFDRKY